VESQRAQLCRTAWEPATRNKRIHTPHRILIVDDHAINIVLLEEILGETYVLATAESGEEALALAPRVSL
jgi:PleD family two-component response regulator